MRVALGVDHRGFLIKDELVAFLKDEGHDVIDCGTDSTESVDYPDTAEAVSKAVRHPDPDLCLAMHRIFPAIGLFDAHAEDAHDGFASQRGAIFFPFLSVAPGQRHAAAGLAVGKQRGGKLADGLHVERA